MTVVRHIKDLKETLRGKPDVGFVPTMGAFHEGHLALMRRAKSECRTAVVSLFVNPTQFGPNDDFDSYPRDETRDFGLAESIGIDIMFAPQPQELYLGGSTRVHVGGVSELYEGSCRPGHFDGVATVVLKLFNLVSPRTAYFGLKDLQQCAVIREMVEDLNLAVELHFIETVREPSGLAMSSRNRRLTVLERETASALYREMTEAARKVSDGGAVWADVLSSTEILLNTLGFAIDYFALVDPLTMRPVGSCFPQARLIIAAWLGKVRLIDNVPMPT